MIEVVVGRGALLIGVVVSVGGCMFSYFSTAKKAAQGSKRGHEIKQKPTKNPSKRCSFKRKQNDKPEETVKFLRRGVLMVL